MLLYLPKHVYLGYPMMWEHSVCHAAKRTFKFIYMRYLHHLIEIQYTTFAPVQWNCLGCYVINKHRLNKILIHLDYHNLKRKCNSQGSRNRFIGRFVLIYLVKNSTSSSISSSPSLSLSWRAIKAFNSSCVTSSPNTAISSPALTLPDLSRSRDWSSFKTSARLRERDWNVLSPVYKTYLRVVFMLAFS